MNCRDEAVTQRPDGSGWGQYTDRLPHRSGTRPCPTGERKLDEAIGQDQLGDPIQDDHRSGRKFVDVLNPKPAVGRSLDPPTSLKPFGGELSIQITRCRWRQ